MTDIREINTINMILSRAENDIYFKTGKRVFLLVAPEREPDDKRDPYVMCRMIASSNGETGEVFTSGLRKPVYVKIRQICAYFLKQYFPEMSLRDIGTVLGLGDHTTVIHCLQKVSDMIESEDVVFMKLFNNALEVVTQWIKE